MSEPTPEDLTRPIIGIENRTPQEVFDIMCDRFLHARRSLAAVVAERDEARELAERLKLEARGHASEARTANSTIYEIYQVLSGGKGEPGNWHGAEPAREFVAAAERTIAELGESLSRETRAKTDARYMAEAYHAMLGPTGLKVAAMWEERKVSRVHHSWGPGAAKLTGEQRAQAILDMKAAPSELVTFDGETPADTRTNDDFRIKLNRLGSAETARLAAEQKAADEQAAREADEVYRAAVVEAAAVAIAMLHAGITPKKAREIAGNIAAGLVPGVTMEF